MKYQQRKREENRVWDETAKISSVVWVRNYGNKSTDQQAPTIVDIISHMNSSEIQVIIFEY